MAKELLGKRALISQANTTVVVVTSIAAFVLIFCAVATKTLASQAAYQNRVITKKREAVKQLQADIQAVGQLKTSYKAFTTTSRNVIGGNTVGAGSADCNGSKKDGNNATIILDALPSTYDFGAFNTSLEKLLSCQQLTIGSIVATDESLSQANASTSSTPKPIELTFSVSVQGPYANIQGLISAFERSIRPVQIKSVQLTTGGDGSLSLNLTAKTYYQPGKSLNISQQVVK
ncbi:hypothetical protein EYC59_03455 [Candidatus Saccharibacteria bacterium]|nr:MAG: hypothetical protein EYC59_03455 [Candidatus Saccharibacteria bacterium]